METYELLCVMDGPGVNIHFIACLLLLSQSPIISDNYHLSSQNSTTLDKSKPTVTWMLDGYHLIVTWEHFAEPLHGYYVSLCLLITSSLKCIAPDFVHFDKNARSGRIIGLAPESSYELKVLTKEHACCHGFCTTLVLYKCPIVHCHFSGNKAWNL